jgi:hypothetical protein
MEKLKLGDRKIIWCHSARPCDAHYFLDSGNCLVLQDPHNHATIFSLSFGGLITTDLMRLAQCSWR